MDRLRRVTDLFIEGTERYLGNDEHGKPTLIWVNKLNSFETEEARRDGMVRRGERIMQLAKEDSPERLALAANVDNWSMSELAEARLGQVTEEIYMQVLNDLEAEKEWQERLAMIRRLPTLLDDQNAPPDDPRRTQLEDLMTEYLQEIARRQTALQQERLAELAEMEREALEAAFYDGWRQRASLDEYMAEKAITELFYAIRDCVATERGQDPDGKRLWDHTDCNHAQRLMDQRSQVRALPERVIEIAQDALESINVTQREAGNLAAPASSSGSSEQPSEAGASTVSIPEETSPAVPTISASQ